MRRLAGVALLALLSACSKGGEAPDPAASEASGFATLAPDRQAAPAASPSPAGISNLTGQVSALNADVSGLNMRVTDFATVIDLSADALFAYDKAELTPKAEAQLRKAAEVIRRSPGQGAIQVIGHTDSHGGNAYNQTLSEARARTVADWFGEQVGVRKRAFEVSGKGETAPVAPNEGADGKDDPTGRAKNRRVEVVVPKE